MHEFQDKVKQSKQQLSSIKGFIVALIFFVIIIAIANPLSSWLAERGFKEGKTEYVYLAAGTKRNLLNYETAEELYRRLIKTFPQKNEAAFYQLAFCLDRQAKKKEAIEAYSEYLKYFPSGEFSLKAQEKLKALISKN
ncbi:tetratricopeptide repeat protein [Lentisphaera profundi]|uniref:Tetratricopeptide repeat protein n=1 Tax=Lentisphaera profundi TaxID=1658616 RepID=A0ABY7VTT6_9BACT|nr:tetratricopeptide repeat protein [Lentisphaera profundi]WDE96236.1 tetratricopeptide repeat protein [Lentisphaera profundi]